MNVSDVSYKLAAASLQKGVMPDVASIRSEEFINAFDYRDPEPAAGVPVAFVSERARWPFAQNRDLLRFSIKTAAAGRQPGRPLNIVLLLDNSGSMERADRVAIIREALKIPGGTVAAAGHHQHRHLLAHGAVVGGRRVRRQGGRGGGCSHQSYSPGRNKPGGGNGISPMPPRVVITSPTESTASSFLPTARPIWERESLKR